MLNFWKNFRRFCDSNFNYFRIFICLLISFLTACSPGLDIDSEIGREAIILEARLALNDGSCQKAIDLIEPLYESEYTSNIVRQVRASAQACRAGVNFFSLMNTLTDTSTTLCSGSNCNGLWTTITKLFYVGSLSSDTSDTLDHRKYGAWFATDAIMAMLKIGASVPEAFQVNPGTYNPGSVYYTDRTDDSNLRMLLTSLSVIGAINNRYGQTTSLPFTSLYKRRQDLPWVTTGDTGATMDNIKDLPNLTETACSYGGAVMNMLDAITALSGDLSVNIDTQLNTVLNAAFTVACQLGTGAGGCGLTAAQCNAYSEIPAKLRNRTSCADDSTTIEDDIMRCAAASISVIVNDSAQWGWLSE